LDPDVERRFVDVRCPCVVIGSSNISGLFLLRILYVCVADDTRRAKTWSQNPVLKLVSVLSSIFGTSLSGRT